MEEEGRQHHEHPWLQEPFLRAVVLLAEQWSSQGMERPRKYEALGISSDSHKIYKLYKSSCLGVKLQCKKKKKKHWTKKGLASWGRNGATFFTSGVLWDIWSFLHSHHQGDQQNDANELQLSHWGQPKLEGTSTRASGNGIFGKWKERLSLGEAFDFPFKKCYVFYFPLSQLKSGKILKGFVWEF